MNSTVDLADRLANETDRPLIEDGEQMPGVPAPDDIGATALDGAMDQGPYLDQPTDPNEN